MSTFAARYPGVCPVCDTTIEIGQEVIYSEGSTKPEHVECPTDDLNVEHGFCPRCFIALPASGVCDDCA